MGLLERHQVLVRRHANLWACVFAGATEQKKAEVFLWEAFGTSGYCATPDQIHFFLEPNSYDLDDLDEAYRAGVPAMDGNPNNWRLWEQEVVHELIHEYQEKVVRTVVTAEGRSLDKAIPAHQRHSGCGHDEVFYTAVVEVAKRLNMSPQVLAEHL